MLPPPNRECVCRLNERAFQQSETIGKHWTCRALAPHLQSTIPQSTSGKNTFAEIVALDRLIELEADWRALVARALEPNAFLDPAFAIPLLRSETRRKPPCFLLVWGTPSRRQLIGLLPLASRLRLALFVRSAASMHAPLGTPLLDRDQGLEAIDAMVKGLRNAFKASLGLKLTNLPKESPTALLLNQYAVSERLELTVFNTYERACLLRTPELGDFPEGFISAKRRKFYRQQRRRLGKSGEVTYRSFRSPIEIRAAAERFLRLEASGWKGRRKTAFLAQPSEAGFFRAMTEAMAQYGNCRIDSLDLAGVPIAMGVILESGDRGFYWKTCFDERFAALSPGAQLTLDLTRTQLASPPIRLTDSCAIPDHPMINHIWRQRLAMADVFLSLRPGSHRLIAAAAACATAHRRLRATAKQLLKQWRELRLRKPST